MAAQAECELCCLKKYNLLGHGHAPGPGTNPRVNSQNRPSATLRLFPSRPNMFGGIGTLTQCGLAHPSHLLEHPLVHQVLDSAAKMPCAGEGAPAPHPRREQGACLRPLNKEGLKHGLGRRHRGQESWSPLCEQCLQGCNFGATSSLCWGQLAMVPKGRHPFLPTHSSLSIHCSVLAVMMGLGPWGSSMKELPKIRARHPVLAHGHTAW